MQEFPAGAFFAVIQSLGPLAVYATLVLASLLSMSSVDTQQNAVMAIFIRDVQDHQWNMNWLRLLMVVTNVPAVLLSVAGFSVLELFLVSNILSCALVPAIFLGLSARYATPTSFVVGTVAGLLAIPVAGFSFTGNFVGGLSWVWLPEGPYHWSTLATFVAVIVTSSVVTASVAFFEIHRRPQSFEENLKRLAAYKNASETETSFVPESTVSV